MSNPYGIMGHFRLSVDGVSLNLGRAAVPCDCRGSEGQMWGYLVSRGGEVGMSLSLSTTWVKSPQQPGLSSWATLSGQGCVLRFVMPV